ncbi:MAG: S9 family peptidase [Pseudomonadota bacterium]
MDRGSAQADAASIDGLIAPPMSAQDLITMPRVGGADVSPDGRFAVFSVTRTDPESYERAPVHYLLDLTENGGKPVALKLGIGGFAPAIGSDGFLYFLSYEHPDPAQDVRARLWRIALEPSGSETDPILVADFGGANVTGFKLAPTADKLAVWGPFPRECATLACDTDEEAAEADKPIGSGRLYAGNGGFYRHWDRWIAPKVFNRVFVISLEDGISTGKDVPLDGIDPAIGLSGNTPTMPFGGSEDIAWAPGGDGIYFVAREANADEPSSTDLDIYFSDLSGAAPVELTANNRALDAVPAPSPDGRYLAYLAMARPGYESDRQVIHLRNLETGQTRALTSEFDRSFGTIVWSKDSSYLLASAADTLDTPVFKIDPASSQVDELDLMAGNEAHIANIVPLADDGILFTRDSIGVPSELFRSESLGRARPLTDMVTTRLGQRASTVTTRFQFAGADNAPVWGQITRLENQTGPIPAILYIHGGPQGSFADRWSSRWNPRLVASQGYAVISVDFHGSTGYGQDFTDAINRDWGGKPLEDLQKGLAAALEIDPQIDGNRACAMGASYGGYMVNWIAGNWPDRFDCLVQHDGLFDLRSFYYATEELWFPRWDFGGSYAEASEIYERWNPVNHVEKWQTPMLVIAGEKDFRVPYTQGLQSFTALKEQGVPAELLAFPDENHWVLGAKNSLQWHRTVFSWLNRWLSETEAPDAPIKTAEQP